MSYFEHPSDIEPLFPKEDVRRLERATQVMTRAAALGSALHPEVRGRVAELVRSMNGYYSNLIEGHRTHPADLEAALRGDFADDPKHRENQILHRAHVVAQREIDARLAAEPALNVASPDFIRWVHERLYSQLPEELRWVEDKGHRYEIVPGALRDYNVAVGRHLAPLHSRLLAFLDSYAGFYKSHQGPVPQAVVAAAAAHHRLTWIHPFGDGNGRVARLVTHAWLSKIGCGSGGLWTLSRGLARNEKAYKATLDATDSKRLHDFDGRGYLSEEKLGAFCDFILGICLDQIDLMSKLLELDDLNRRMAAYCRLQEEADALPRGGHLITGEVLRRGSLKRGDIARLAGVSPRTAQGITAGLLKAGLLESPSAKGLLFIAFPANACAAFFPELYPGAVELA
jgi:Fic family protein